MKDRALIIDLDGTLSNCEHRVHHMQKSPKDWKSFNLGICDDNIYEWCKELIVTFKKIGHKIIFVTGRDEDCRNISVKWLKKFEVPYDLLLMRRVGDFREDDEVKKEIFFKQIKESYNISFVVDDRKSVVKMWREIGLTCLQCAEGDF